MAWPFLYLVREDYHSSNPWGNLYVNEFLGIDGGNSWRFFSYTYELPWKADKKGKSSAGKSQIDIGTYEMKERTDGPKGWRLELMGTHHRKHIQLHRAHKSLYIKGCILPVHRQKFGPFPFGIEKDRFTQAMSEISMHALHTLYKDLAKIKKGNPSIEIAAKLPPLIKASGKTAIA